MCLSFETKAGPHSIDLELSLERLEVVTQGCRDRSSRQGPKTRVGILVMQAAQLNSVVSLWSIQGLSFWLNFVYT